MLVEHLQREDLSPREEAAALEVLQGAAESNFLQLRLVRDPRQSLLERP